MGEFQLQKEIVANITEVIKIIRFSHDVTQATKYAERFFAKEIFSFGFSII